MPEEFIGLAAVILIFGGGGAILFSITPIGKAIAARISGKKAQNEVDEATVAELDDLRREVEDLRSVGQQVNELGERVDFLERLVAKQKEADRLPPVRER